MKNVLHTYNPALHNAVARDSVSGVLLDSSLAESSGVQVQVQTQDNIISANDDISVPVSIDELRAGIHGLNHVLLRVTPLIFMCDVADLATECVSPWDQVLVVTSTAYMNILDCNILKLNRLNAGHCDSS